MDGVKMQREKAGGGKGERERALKADKNGAADKKCL